VHNSSLGRKHSDSVAQNPTLDWYIRSEASEANITSSDMYALSCHF